MKYEYFVSYAHKNGIGNMFGTLSREINSIEQGEWLQKFVQESIQEKYPNCGYVCILNFKMLRAIPEQ